MNTSGEFNFGGEHSFGVPGDRLSENDAVHGEQANALHAAVSRFFIGDDGKPVDHDEPVFAANIHGDTFEIRRSPMGYVAPAKPALGGLWRRLRRDKSPSQGRGYRYDITWTEPDSSIATTLNIYDYHNVSVLGDMRNPKNDQPIFIGDDILQAKVEEATAKLAESQQFTAEEMLEVKQMGSCERITGREARELWDTIQPAVNNALSLGPEMRGLAHGRTQFTDVPDHTGNFPIGFIGALRSTGLDGAKDTAYASIGFIDHPLVSASPNAGPESVFIVEVVQGLEGSNDTVVKYLLKHPIPDQLILEEEPVALDPTMRAEIKHAMARQLTPDNLRDKPYSS